MNTHPMSHAEAAPESTPTVAPAPAESSSIFSLPLSDLRMGDPIRWIQLGWADFVRCPRIGLFYGLCFFAMGHALMAVFWLLLSTTASLGLTALARHYELLQQDVQRNDVRHWGLDDYRPGIPDAQLEEA